MMIQKKLLVLMDGSERSIETVNYIKAFIPLDENTRIVLFHVWSGMSEAYRELGADLARAGEVGRLRNHETERQGKIRMYLETARKMLITGGFPEASIEIKFHLLEKGVARDIIAEARNGYSAIILRRRGMGALASIILGSVAVKLLQSLTFIPMIIVGQAPPVKKILLAVDSSESSMKAVEFTAAWMGGHDYEACIFHAIPGLGLIHFDLAEMRRACTGGAAADTCIEAFKLKIARMFQVIKDRLVSSGFDPEKIFEKVVTGVLSRSEAIVKEAEAGGYGAIVVGRRGLSKVDAFFMGRVGHKIVYGGNRFTVWVVP
ncbi:MAG: universal stress protein [Desulfobacteraceae bacterium]|nr:universal stress protein [Desulfobacteraceae bacterium]